MGRSSQNDENAPGSKEEPARIRVVCTNPGSTPPILSVPVEEMSKMTQLAKDAVSAMEAGVPLTSDRCHASLGLYLNADVFEYASTREWPFDDRVGVERFERFIGSAFAIDYWPLMADILRRASGYFEKWSKDTEKVRRLSKALYAAEPDWLMSAIVLEAPNKATVQPESFFSPPLIREMDSDPEIALFRDARDYMEVIMCRLAEHPGWHGYPDYRFHTFPERLFHVFPIPAARVILMESASVPFGSKVANSHALEKAARCDSWLVEFLLDGNWTTYPCNDDRQAVFEALAHGHRRLVDRLMERDVPIEEWPLRDAVKFVCASIKGDVFEDVLSQYPCLAKCDYNSYLVDTSGCPVKSPLCEAVLTNSLSLVTSVIACLNIDVNSENHRVSLGIACQVDDWRIFDHLLYAIPRRSCYSMAFWASICTRYRQLDTLRYIMSRMLTYRHEEQYVDEYSTKALLRTAVRNAVKSGWIDGLGVLLWHPFVSDDERLYADMFAQIEESVLCTHENPRETRRVLEEWGRKHGWI